MAPLKTLLLVLVVATLATGRPTTETPLVLTPELQRIVDKYQDRYQQVSSVGKFRDSTIFGSKNSGGLALKTWRFKMFGPFRGT